MALSQHRIGIRHNICVEYSRFRVCICGFPFLTSLAATRRANLIVIIDFIAIFLPLILLLNFLAILLSTALLRHLHLTEFIFNFVLQRSRSTLSLTAGAARSTTGAATTAATSFPSAGARPLDSLSNRREGTRSAAKDFFFCHWCLNAQSCGSNETLAVRLISQ